MIVDQQREIDKNDLTFFFAVYNYYPASDNENQINISTIILVHVLSWYHFYSTQILSFVLNVQHYFNILAMTIKTWKFCY